MYHFSFDITPYRPYETVTYHTCVYEVNRIAKLMNQYDGVSIRKRGGVCYVELHKNYTVVLNWLNAIRRGGKLRSSRKKYEANIKKFDTFR